ncbi:uncharacterized protein FIESC28_10282 [Fusarium coffeatum]|uniref:Uncharacterized protein n=1 Tax=Fusarium coffeatum TaxID=231269 RepID=A0A366QW44_9HYPO|nr:uncharacterized protein FIESC28_10282 [Fusarium coffeatum]RBR08336.1 hypothetical protein FIESC28_10282 [Fusarium coffeatum]
MRDPDVFASNRLFGTGSGSNFASIGESLPRDKGFSDKPMKQNLVTGPSLDHIAAKALQGASSIEVPVDEAVCRGTKILCQEWSPTVQDIDGESVALERSVSRYPDPDDVLKVFESILEAGGDLGKEIVPTRLAPYFSVPEDFSFDHNHKINAIHIAVYRGLTEVVEYLIKGRYMALGPFTYGPLDHALQGGHIETSKSLIQHGADLGDKSSSALEAAALRGLTEIVVLLVDEKGMDPNGLGGGWNPLSCAMLSVSAGNEDDALATFTFLLERGANPDLPGYSCELDTENWYESPLAQAFSLKQFEIGLLLLQHGAHPGNDVIPLHKAASDRLRRYLLPNESGLIKFMIEFLDRLPNTKMPQRPSNLGCKPFRPLEGLLSEPSLKSLFVAHTLLQDGFQIPETRRKALPNLARKSRLTRRDVELILICYPFMDLRYMEKKKLDCVVRIVENERKGTRLFSRDDSPALEPEPGTSSQYDLSEIMQQWRIFVDMEFDKAFRETNFHMVDIVQM